MSKHVIIIGGGVIGLSAAEACLKRGHRVTVVDRQPQQRSGCSFGNAGMVVPSHFIPLAAPGMVALGFKWMWNPESPFYIKPRLDLDLVSWGIKFMQAATRAHVEAASPVLRDLNLASRELYLQYAAEGEDFGLVTKGLLMLCKTQHGLDEEAAVAAKANALGVPAEVLDAAGTAKVDPTITMDVAGSVWFPKDCHMSPEKFIAVLERRILAAGGTFRWSTEVTGWKKEGGKLVAIQTPAGDLEADEFVLCGGAWSDDLVRDLGLKIPMQAGKGYSLTHPAPVELPTVCSVLTEARVAVTPMGDSLRVGGTMEISGKQEKIEPRRVAGILKALPAYFPKFKPSDFDGIQPWQGFRPCSPDGMPYLGRTQAASNLTVATGHSMMGLSLGPESGRLAAVLVDRERPEHDLALLSPDRFA
ncbi:FAD-dependent oxidoreductase [Luteolibacter sp. LG18]|uniref:NAD(P)/FAD-dependent oxidoreductase n=1 Tax=Luteolibacter sp. LG18 TaxID=2819286 RepID=UPI002B31AA73|nr:D-amino-acid dehydrogenase [Luteolibacter sp. LG18]